jgi:flagellar hook assembly protein FlgD
MILTTGHKSIFYILFIVMAAVFLIAPDASASGVAPNMPLFVGPANNTYFNSTTSVQLQWQVPTDPEGDAIELKVVFFKSDSQPASIPSSTPGASSEVAALKPMFSLPTPVDTNPAGATPPGTIMSFQVLEGFTAIPLSEGKWWWDVYAWDGSGYSAPPRQPRSFILDFTKPVVSNLVLSNPIFSPASPDANKRTTTLAYTLSETSLVTIEVLNSSNVVVRTLEAGVQHTVPPTAQSVTWDGAGATADGVYTIRVRAKDLANNDSEDASINVTISSNVPSISFGTPALANNPFSPLPASPGVKDTTTVSYIVNDTADINILVYPQGSPSTITKVLLPKTKKNTGNYTQAWDGTDDLTGNSVNDGIYTISVISTNEIGFASTITHNVTVDKTVTDISPFGAAPTPFSPNISPTNITFSLSEDATVEIIIKDQARVLTVRNLRPPTYMLQKIAPQTYQEAWDGRDSGGNLVADAIYTYEIKTEDLAGNTNTNVGNIRVDKTGPIIGPYSVTPKAISPSSSPGITDQATISYNISKEGTVEIRIISKTGPLVRQFGPYLKALGSHVETWDGNDAGGNVVGEGDYNIEIYLIDSAGNIGNPNPAVISVAVDNTPPALTGLLVIPPFFSPQNSIANFKTTMLKYNLSESAEVTIKVLDSLNNQVRTLMTNVPQSPGLKNTTWDGKDDTGAYVTDGTYTFDITAVDAALNSTTTTTTVQVDNTGPVVNILSATPTPFAPDSIDPTLRKVNVKYILNDARVSCTTEINVKTRIGAVVKNLGSGLVLPTGVLQTATWDGKNTLGQIVEDGTYGVYILAVDQAGNSSIETSVEVYLQNRGPSITKVRFMDNRDTIDTNDSIEITFDTNIDDSAFIVGGIPIDVSTVFQIIGSGTFGTGARIDTGAAVNDKVIEIRLGNGYTKIVENGDTLMINTGSDRVMSFPTKVVTKDNIPHLILDGSPPYLISSTYFDIGNDGLNRGDHIVMTFNEGVSVAFNSPAAVRLLPTGRGYTIGGGAGISTGDANQIVISLGDVSTTSIIIRGIFDPFGVNPVPTGINVVLNQTAIVDNAGNPATPNLNIPTPPIPGVDIGSNDSIGPKVAYAKYYDKNTVTGKGGLSDGDIVYIGFDKAIMVSPDPNFSPGTVFKLPVANDAFGAGASFTYTGVKEVGVTLGANPMMTVKGIYSLGNDIAGRPSGVDINIVNAANPEISDLAGNPALTNIPVDIGSVDNIAPKILIGKVTAQIGGEIVDNVINPTTGTFTIIAVVDDNTLKDGDVKVTLTSIFPEMTNEVNLERDGNTTTFKKIVVFPTNPYLTGAKTFSIKATDFSGNASQAYTFTAYVVEPAASVIGEINPSSVPKRIDANADPEEFIVTLKPKVMSYNLGIDKISIKHPGGGYSYTQDTIDIFIGERKLIQNVNYTFNKTTVGANLDITLVYDAKITEAMSDQKVLVKFKLNVPMTSNSPTGSTFEVAVNNSSLLAPYQQSVTGADADGDALNNNKLCVVVSDVAIEEVQTKLDYSEFFWRINFVVKFSKELATATAPKCFYKPENAPSTVNEMPVQFTKFENKADATDSNKIKAYFTGYARVPIDNVDYLSSFTFFAKSFYDTDGVLIAKVYKKKITMSPGFIVTAFSNPIDARDLIITVLATTAVTQQFQLGIRQPGKVPIYRSRNELISHRQNLYTYKYRIDENYTNQIDMAVLDPGATFTDAPALNAAKLNGASKKSVAGFGTAERQAGVYSVKLMASDLSKDVNFASADGLCGLIKTKEDIGGARTFIIAPQYSAAEGGAQNKDLVRLSGAYQFAPADIQFKTPAAVKFKIHPDAEQYLKSKNSGIDNIASDKIGIYKQNGARWEFVAGGVCGTDGGYHAYVESLGIYAMFADIEKPEIKMLNMSDGGEVKDYIELTARDNGAGIDEANIKIVIDGKQIRVKPAAIEKTGGEIKMRFNSASLKDSGVSVGKTSRFSFEISDNSGNIAKSPEINYQAANPAGIYQSIIAYPNPAKTFCGIQYLLTQNAAETELKIYDSAVNLVHSSGGHPVNASNTAHVIRWNLANDDGDRVSNGVYHYKLKIILTGGETIEKTGKIAVIK